MVMFAQSTKVGMTAGRSLWLKGKQQLGVFFAPTQHRMAGYLNSRSGRQGASIPARNSIRDYGVICATRPHVLRTVIDVIPLRKDSDHLVTPTR